MGTPVERQNFSYAFFILAALIALCTLWAVYDEAFTRRPWKQYQEMFSEVETKKAEADLAFVRKEVEANKKELEALQKQLSEIDQKIASSNVDELKKEQFRLDLEVKDATQNVGFAKSDLDAEYYTFRVAKEHGDEDAARKAQDNLAKISERIARNQEVLAKRQAEYFAVQSQLDALYAERGAVQKKLEALTEPIVEAERRLASAKSRSTSLEQYWVVKLGRVDRCHNCHAGVDRCGFSQPWEVLAARAKGGPGLEDDAAVARKFCITTGTLQSYVDMSAALCEGEAAEPADRADLACRDAAALARYDEVGKLYCGPQGALKKWRVKDGQACGEEATLASVDAAIAKREYSVPFVFQTHPARSELLASHPPETFGCTACHGGQGVQTKGIAGQPFDHGRDDHHWAVWQDPLFAKVEVWGQKIDLTAAACGKCHQGDINLKHAEDLNKGRKLVMDLGCYGCHPIEGFNDLRRPGPQLTNVQEKVANSGWLVEWIRYPRDFRPRTRMPNFWPEALTDGEKDASGRPLPGKVASGTKGHDLRQEESIAIAAYLWSTSAPPMAQKQLEGSAEEGAKLFDTVGCRACHVVEKDAVTRPTESSDDRDFAPNLHNIGAKTSETWLYTWLKDPKGYWPLARMPNLRLTDREAGSLAKFLAQKTGGHRYAPPAELKADFPREQFTTLVAKGKGLIAKYGCFGCHDIKGFEESQKIGAELTEFGAKAIDLLDFGDAVPNPLQQTWYNWIDTKLRHPRIYRYERVDTRMPQFDVSDDEVKSLMTFLKSQKGEKVETSYLAENNDRRKAVVAGDRLVAYFGCRNCHNIDGQGGTVRDRYAEDQLTLAPPLIYGQGAKTQPNWLFHFLKQPGAVQIRPWLSIRMPTFGFSDADATTLVRYFSAKDNAPYPYTTVPSVELTGERLTQAKAMFTELKCLSCHTTGEPPPGVSLADLAPDLTMAKERLRPEWIPHWLADPQKLMPGTRMPGYFPDGISPLPQYFNGDSKTQMEALRDYIIYEVGKERGQAQAGGAKQGKQRAAAPAQGARG